MSNNKTLKKNALVYGGSRGIGAAAVSRLIKDGFNVAFTYASSSVSANELVDKLKMGENILAIKADSRDAQDIQRAVETAVEKFGKIDMVLVNAGLYKTGLVDDFSLEDLDQMISVNVRGVYLSIQKAVPHLNEGAKVITIGSNVSIRTGFPGASVYQFTKTALVGMVKGLALDLASRKITVNNIQPGPTATDLHNNETVEILSNMSPLKRIAHPEEIANLVAFLASNEANYITGASLTIDGGFTL